MFTADSEYHCCSNAGVVWANGYNLFDPASPFGGIRHSGFGREGGLAGLWPYLEFSA